MSDESESVIRGILVSNLFHHSLQGQCSSASTGKLLVLGQNVAHTHSLQENRRECLMSSGGINQAALYHQFHQCIWLAIEICNGWQSYTTTGVSSRIPQIQVKGANFRFPGPPASLGLTHGHKSTGGFTLWSADKQLKPAAAVPLLFICLPSRLMVTPGRLPTSSRWLWDLSCSTMLNTPKYPKIQCSH